MKYRPLGRSGLNVSPLCLGTMTFGDRTDEATAREMVALAFDAGINFIDTPTSIRPAPRSASRATASARSVRAGFSRPR